MDDWQYVKTRSMRSKNRTGSQVDELHHPPPLESPVEDSVDILLEYNSKGIYESTARWDNNTSYGIICYRVGDAGVEFLVTEKTASIGFICLFTGQYSNQNSGYFTKLLSNTTAEEAEVFMCGDYKRVVDWVYSKTNSYYSHTSDRKGEAKYRKLFSATSPINPHAIFDRLLRASWQFHPHPEWDFPKGRRSFVKETPVLSAMREFMEELSLDENKVVLHDTALQTERKVAKDTFTIEPVAYLDSYTGINNNTYSTVYFTFNASGSDFMKPMGDCEKVMCNNCEVSFATWVTLPEFIHSTSTFKNRDVRASLLKEISQQITLKEGSM